MDIVLEYIQHQNSRTETVDDLVADLAIIGKDMYDSSVVLLDEHVVEINPDEVKLLVIKVLHNVKNFNLLLDTLESATDLMKDVGPIAHEVIIDFTKKMAEFEQKGYFEFVAGMGKIVDTIIVNYKKEDFVHLCENIVVILDIAKNITDKRMLSSVNQALVALNNTEAKHVKPLSLWKLFKEMRSPQMKQAMGFAVSLVKNLSDKK